MKILSLFVIILCLATFSAPVKSDWDATGRKISNLFSGTFWKMTHSIKYKPYKLTSADREEVKNCVITLNLRIWHHMKEKDDCENLLTNHETYCKRMGSFKPGPNDPKLRKARRDSPDRYIHLTTEYNKWTSPYHPTIMPTSKDLQEIEDCFFNRDWQDKSEHQLTSHEAFCRRISDYKFPNETEALQNWNEGAFDMVPFKKAWDKVPEVGLEDFGMMVYCHPEDIEPVPLTNERYSKCEGYYERARKNNWRQIRLSKLHDCYFLAMLHIVTEPRPDCIGVEDNYKAMYYSGKW